MAESVGAKQQEKTRSRVRPVRERVVQKQLVSARHGTVNELIEDQIKNGGNLQQRAAVRFVSDDVASPVPTFTESRFAHDFSRVPAKGSAMRRPLQAAPRVSGHGYDDDHVHIMRVPTESGVRQSPPRYSYSTHCGWIDWDHAETDLPATLITRIREASARLATVPAGGRTAPGAAGPGRVVGPQMTSQAGGILLSGVTPVAYLRRPLNEAEILRVALRIFMLQSIGFEALQAWTQWVGHSSYSEEDLPSNMIGFYMNARRFNRARIERMCGAWNVADSLRRFRGYRFRQNRTFRPLSLPPGGRWPAELSSVRPATVDGPLFGFSEAVFETPFERRRACYVGGRQVACGDEPDIRLVRSGTLHIEQIGGTGPVNLSNQQPGAGPNFEVRYLPARHDLGFRWIIADSQDRRYLMWGARGQVFQYGTQYNAYIPSRTRALLISRGIRNATIMCRVIAARGRSGSVNRLLTFPVSFTR